MERDVGELEEAAVARPPAPTVTGSVGWYTKETTDAEAETPALRSSD